MPSQNIPIPISRQAFIPYVLPFAAFGLCTYMAPLLPISPGIAYSLKTIIVSASLFYFWKYYKEEIKVSFDWLAPVSGALVFFLWILIEGFYPRIETPGFNPYDYASGSGLYWIIFFRMAGAVLVVPVMEELFWRSFALRFLVESNFKRGPLGTFTWFSFIVISIAFGFEHHHWLAGILAGILYAGVLYRTKNLFVPVLSHAVTNFLLGDLRPLYSSVGFLARRAY